MYKENFTVTRYGIFRENIILVTYIRVYTHIYIIIIILVEKLIWRTRRENVTKLTIWRNCVRAHDVFKNIRVWRRIFKWQLCIEYIFQQKAKKKWKFPSTRISRIRFQENNIINLYLVVETFLFFCLRKRQSKNVQKKKKRVFFYRLRIITIVRGHFKRL